MSKKIKKYVKRGGGGEVAGAQGSGKTTIGRQLRIRVEDLDNLFLSTTKNI